MADPATLMLAAAATQAIGAISEGNTQNANYKSQAKALEYNASIKRENAAQVAREASLREDRQRRQAALVLGRQRAGLAEAGIGLGTGSALDIQESDEANAELDALSIRYEGATKRRALLQDAQMDDYSAKTARMNGKAAKKAGYIKAIGSMLGGAGRYNSAMKTAPTDGATPEQLGWK